jgi:hypothetical protein
MEKSNLSKEYDSAPEDIKTKLMDCAPVGTLDFVTSMKLIKFAEEESKFGGYADFLRLLLGKENYKKMATLGYIKCGICVEENKEDIIDTYSVTQRYKSWCKLI